MGKQKKNRQAHVENVQVKREPVMASELFPAIETAFKVLLSARFCAAIWSHISDCDETFNYWEPLHYLIYGKGLQTWEYSPEFALRSYVYLLFHGVPAWIYTEILHPNPMLVFYFIRCILGVMCATMEVYFYKAVCREFGVNIGRIWLIFQLFSPGMFIASTALLPSSFSMYAISAAFSVWWFQQYKLAIFFVAISAILGWPFVAILGLPIVYDILVRKQHIKLFITWTLISFFTISIPLIVIDSSYFDKMTYAPLNLIVYNIFTSHGPNLYGVEDLSFYLTNGLLNFNVVWLLALATPILLLIASYALPIKSKSTLSLPYWLSLAPLYIWLFIFFNQPHKEERFLFPIYPMICLCGAISVDTIQKIFFRIKSWALKLPVGTHYLNHSMFIVAFMMFLTSIVGLSRILSLYKNYHAPMDLLIEMNNNPDALPKGIRPNEDINVCIGKDWYRFPNSFFFPNKKFRIRFLKSEFDGMLPAYFTENENGTKIVHDYFNDMNQENVFMYFDYEKCHFLLDIDYGEEVSSKLEPNYSALTKEWEIYKSLSFINTKKSNRLLRAFYIPFINEMFVKYGNFNILRRVKKERE